MRYVEIDTAAEGPQRVIRLIETDEELEGAEYISVTERPEIGAASWYDVAVRDFVGAPPAPAPTAADHCAAVAARRYLAETGGTTVNGMQVNTDRESRALMTGAAVSSMLDSGYSVRWKTADGFVQLSAGQIIGLSSAVRAHVQACFDREAELLQAIDDGTYNDAMLDEGWPDGQVPAPAAG